MRHFICVLLLLIAGCSHADPPSEVVIYCSVDEPIASPIFKQFEQQTGIHVRFVADTEAAKSASLAEKLLAEKDHPQADVYWDNEPFHMIELADQGLFEPYRPAAAADVPMRWTDPQKRFIEVGLRARMLVLSSRPADASLVALVHGMADLGNPALKGKIGLCHPAVGTCSGQMAALYMRWGEPKFIAWVQSLKANDLKLLGGNSVVPDQIGAGNLAIGIADNDDVANALADHAALTGALPDQSPDDIGTLMIPTTLALVASAPHPDLAKKLIDFLAAPEIEKQLIDAKFCVASVRNTSTVHAMDINYVAAAGQMRHVVELMLGILQSR